MARSASDGARPRVGAWGLDRVAGRSDSCHPRGVTLRVRSLTLPALMRAAATLGVRINRQCYGAERGATSISRYGVKRSC
jgi:hypothetical protein